jgi:protein-disulfide isomerase
MLLAGCAAQPGAGADPALQQKVADQEARIAGLEGKVSALQTAVAQAGTRPAATRAPTPAPLPAVTDLPVSGTTKGVADAKVTITEYSDYL